MCIISKTRLESQSPGSRPNSTAGSESDQAKPFLAVKPKLEDEDGPICADDPRPHVPDGEYDVECVEAKSHRYPLFKREAVILTMAIVDGPHAGVMLERFYNVPGGIKRGSNFYREWTLANQGTPPRRREKLALKKFKHKLFRVEVTTVKTDRDGHPLPVSLRYSRVSRIIDLLVTNEKVVS